MSEIEQLRREIVRYLSGDYKPHLDALVLLARVVTELDEIIADFRRQDVAALHTSAEDDLDEDTTSYVQAGDPWDQELRQSIRVRPLRPEQRQALLDMQARIRARTQDVAGVDEDVSRLREE